MPGKKPLTTEEWIKKVAIIHHGKYDYSKVEYSKRDKKVCIICPLHGEFWQTAGNHISYGCFDCGHGEKNKARAFITTEEIVRRACGVHGGLYDYSKVDFKREGKHPKIEIVCREHGSFWSSIDNHIRHKSGCPLCANSFKGHRNSKLKDRETSLYFLEFYNNDEKFLKIGTTIHSIDKRYGSYSKRYKYEVIKEKKMSYLDACALEQKIKREFKEYRYTPKLEFTGRTECFMPLINIKEQIVMNMGAE